MRRPRDYDAELSALDARARDLRTRKLIAIGELVIATGADAIPVDVLAGVLLAGVETKDAAIVEGWRKRGAAFFQTTSRSAARRNRGDARGAPADGSSAKPPAGSPSAQ